MISSHVRARAPFFPLLGRFLIHGRACASPLSAHISFRTQSFASLSAPTIRRPFFLFKSLASAVRRESHTRAPRPSTLTANPSRESNGPRASLSVVVSTASATKMDGVAADADKSVDLSSDGAAYSVDPAVLEELRKRDYSTLTRDEKRMLHQGSTEKFVFDPTSKLSKGAQKREYRRARGYQHRTEQRQKKKEAKKLAKEAQLAASEVAAGTANDAANRAEGRAPGNKRPRAEGVEDQEAAGEGGAEDGEDGQTRKKARISLKAQRRERAMAAKSSPDAVRVAIDCSWEHTMAPGEINSLAYQIKQIYAENLRHEHPASLFVTSLGGETEKALAKLGDYATWPAVTASARHYSEHVEDASSIVFLSPDSPNVLETVDVGKMYIIGGIVDRTRFKNLSLDEAVRRGMTTARLPLQEHVRLKNSSILTLLSVFQMLLAVRHGTDWPTAIRNALPARFILGHVSTRAKRKIRHKTSGQGEDAARQGEGEPSHPSRSPSPSRSGSGSPSPVDTAQ